MKDFNKALSYSFLLLKYRDRSSSEVASRLRIKGYASAIRKEVIEYLKENNYINDEDFARLFVDYSVEKGWGPRRIEFNLKRLGIPSQLRKQVFKKGCIYNKKIGEIIQRKLTYYRAKKPAIPAQKIWQKITAHLINRGFEYGAIYQEMRNLGVDRFEDK